MARRLSFQGYDGSHPVALPGVPAPLRGEGRSHSLAQTLEIALRRAGLPLGYNVVMGLSGLAFRTPRWPGAPEVAAEDATRAVGELSEALGQCLALTDGAGQSEDELLAAVARAVDQGRPCVALGWGSEKHEWSIITGYDHGKRRLLGHCLLDAPREQYEAWPPALAMLVTVTGRPQPRGPEAVEAALQRGARRLEEEAAARYRTWIEEMRLLDDAPDAAHELAVELWADARAAAAEFAEEVAAYEPEVPAAWLARAAELWREVVRLLEARGLPQSAEALEALQTREGRGDWAELLEAAAGMEAEAASAIERAHAVDFPPEEAAQW